MRYQEQMSCARKTADAAAGAYNSETVAYASVSVTKKYLVIKHCNTPYDCGEVMKMLASEYLVNKFC